GVAALPARRPAADLGGHRRVLQPGPRTPPERGGEEGAGRLPAPVVTPRAESGRPPPGARSLPAPRRPSAAPRRPVGRSNGPRSGGPASPARPAPGTPRPRVYRGMPRLPLAARRAGQGSRPRSGGGAGSGSTHSRADRRTLLAAGGLRGQLLGVGPG